MIMVILNIYALFLNLESENCVFESQNYLRKLVNLFMYSRLYSGSILALPRGKPEERFRQRKEPFVARQRKISAIICALIACSVRYFTISLNTRYWFYVYDLQTNYY